MNKLLMIVLLLLLIFISPAYGSSTIVFNVGNKNVTYTDSSLKEFASLYPEQYIKTFQFSNLPNSYQDYKINEIYVFYIYKERPFNVKVTVFKEGLVLDYIPETTNKDVSISWRLNESFNSLFEGPAYVNMVSSQYGMKFKRTFFGSDKLIETLVVFSNNSININPKKFASEIAQDDFINDINSIMNDKKRQICKPYDNFSVYPEIVNLCMNMDISTKNFHDYSSNYLGGGVNDFENTLQDLNHKIPHYRDFRLMADKWNEFANSDLIKDFCLQCYPEILSSFWSIRNNIATNESYTLTNLNEDLPELIKTIESKSIWLQIIDFIKQFWVYLIYLIGIIVAIITTLLTIRTLIKERNQIKNEIKPFYGGLNKSIEPRLLQIKQKLKRQKKGEKH